MTTARSVTHFRRYQRPEPRWSPVIAVGLLLAFDIALWVYLIHAIWSAR